MNTDSLSHNMFHAVRVLLLVSTLLLIVGVVGADPTTTVVNSSVQDRVANTTVTIAPTTETTIPTTANAEENTTPVLSETVTTTPTTTTTEGITSLSVNVTPSAATTTATIAVSTVSVTPTATDTANPDATNANITTTHAETANVTPETTANVTANATAAISAQKSGSVLSDGSSPAPLNPEFLEYQNQTRNQQQTSSQQLITLSSATGNTATSHVFIVGSLPAPLLLPASAGQRIGQDRVTSVSSESYPVSSSYASSYDLRNYGKVSSVKNQGNSGSCWAFATMGSLESTLLPAESWDFSENNLKNRLSNTYSDGFDRGANTGGQRWESTAYLTRWSGPVTEAEDPYSDTSTTSSTFSPAKHVQNVYYIPARSGPTDNDNIKYALTTWGAVDASMNWTDTAFNSETNAYYYSGSDSTNHDITIVGWDDNYSKANFSTQPAGNGAFIVKNSWGSSWGDNGYFYVSYYDTYIGSRCTVFTGESTSNYNHEYSYDPLGWVNSYGYSGKTTAYFANVYTANSAETLKAVGFYTPEINTAYVVSVYINPTSGPINSSGYAAQTSGTLSAPGYRTVTVPDVALASGQRFSIVVRMTDPTYTYPIPIEYPVSGYSSHATASAGQSYISPDGSSWTDFTSDMTNGNVCLKGYTDDNTVRVDEVGVFRNGAWYLDYNSNGAWDSGIDRYYLWGATGDVPVVGDWNGDGKTEVGVFRNGAWYLDYNGNGAWDSGIDRYYLWGTTGDKPVLGK